jgi:predicted GNAT family acetyltransferase
MAAEQIGEAVVTGQRQPSELNLEDSRFEIRVREHVAFLLFRMRRTKLVLIHTEVPAALQRQGLADALAKAALEYARGHSLRVKVICPFVAKYMVRHPEFQDLVETAGDEA